MIRSENDEFYMVYKLFLYLKSEPYNAQDRR